MAKMKKVVSKMIKIGKAKLVEYEIFVNGEYEDSYCEVILPGNHKVGGYIHINDALAHRGEWQN